MINCSLEKFIYRKIQILYCINCGSCLYFCPVYRQIFDNYGLNYLGGIGIAKIAFLNSMEEAFERGLYFCSNCKACEENCPLGIDIPEIIKKLRNKAVEKGLETQVNQKMMENVEAVGNPFGEELKEGEIPKELFCC